MPHLRAEIQHTVMGGPGTGNTVNKYRLIHYVEKLEIEEVIPNSIPVLLYFLDSL